MPAICSAYFTLFELFFLITGEEYKLLSSLCSSSRLPSFHPSLLGPDIVVSTLFSNTFSLCSPCTVRDEDSQPHNRTGYIHLYISIFTFLDCRREDKYSVLHGSKNYLKLLCSLIFLRVEFWFVRVGFKYLNFCYVF
jgi:hypothetical protein